MSKDSSGDQFARISRHLSTEHGIVGTLELSVATALDLVDTCDYAGVALVSKQEAKVASVVTTDGVVDRAYELQNELGEGPCLQSVAEDETVYAADLRAEERWHGWSSRVVDELDIRSVLSLQLFVGPRTFGSLDLFSASPDAFGLEDRVSALALAAHVAVAVTAAVDRQGMQSALLTRTIIGQAQGMLMERMGLKSDQAFAALVRVSQARNVKLHVIAADIVENGIGPGFLP
jgi:transcriptional regulator with GAF, ATPase, and Fis domain